MNTRRRQASEARGRGRKGSVLIEFAFIAFAFYLLFAGTIELGRMLTISQAIQNAARVGARELGLIALPPTMTFDQALQDPQVRARIYDPYLLAIDVTSGSEPQTANWPVVNQMLLPIMVRSRIGTRTFLHFPGAVLAETNGSRYTVGVPKITGRDANGVEQVTWLPVLEEVRASNGAGPFSLAANAGGERGLVAIRINCAYQATTLTAYRVVGGQPTMSPVEANDGGVSASGTPPGGTPIGTAPTPPATGPDSVDSSNLYSGPYGLGQFYAMGTGNTPVRPYRRLISAQSMFRREVYSQ